MDSTQTAAIELENESLSTRGITRALYYVGLSARGADYAIRSAALIVLAGIVVLWIFGMGFAEGEPAVTGLNPVDTMGIFLVVFSLVLLSATMPSLFTQEGASLLHRIFTETLGRMPSYGAVLFVLLTYPQSSPLFNFMLRFAWHRIL